MTNHRRAEEIRRLLRLQPHPEGGAFRETLRSPMAVSHPQAGARAASTAIYFLLRAGEFSAFHRVRSDESWHLYEGGPLELHLIDPDGRHERRLLGTDLAAGQEPQAVVPAGWWQAARPAEGAELALCGCVVAPGFEFADFEMPTRGELLARFPGLEEWILLFTR